MTNQTFTLLNIILLDSTFHREWLLDINDPDFKNNVALEVNSSMNAEHLSVIVELNFTAGLNDQVQIKSTIKMVGVFKVPDNNDLPIDTFTNVNAPAIIFPFIREHMASLSMKASVNPILLQPINFTKQATAKKE